MLLSEAFERYRQDVIIFSNQSPRTEECHLTTIKLLLIFFGDVPIESLTFEMVRLWKVELDKSRHANTVRMYVIKLRVVLAHCKRLDLNVLNPELIPVPKRTEVVPSFISAEDVASLVNGCRRVRGKAIISLLYGSGIRVSELCSLDRAQLHDNSFTIVGKGGKPRLCFMDERAGKYIATYLSTREDNNQALFISYLSGTRMTPTNIQLTVKAAARNAGFKNHITPHTLRHSFATNLLQNNTNMRYVQEMLGHSSLQTTQMYTHVVNEDLRKVYNEKHTT